MAIFKQNGDLVYVNSALSEETGLYAVDLPWRKCSFLNRLIDANLSILDAVGNVLVGKTTFLTGLSDSMELFMIDSTIKKPLFFEYYEGLFFPINVEEGQITRGAVIFMK
ncbi:MAG TPA: hypothetical protein VFC96_02785 [Anaerovoracaceae bacterium]|nr:hypothetical protein [Anaerovoracaceae bacterium]